MRRVRLAAECLFLDISEVVQAEGLLEQALPLARPGPARAEALSLRAIIWYYHGRLSDAVGLAEQALAEAGTDRETRARILVRLAYLRCQLDVASGLATVNEAMRLLEAWEPRPTTTSSRTRSSCAPRCDSSSWSRWIRTRSSAASRSSAPPAGPGNGRTPTAMAFGLARLTDQLDLAIEMTEELIRAKSGVGWDDPFNLVQLSGLLCLRGRLPEARQVAEAAMEGYDREGTNLLPAWRLARCRPCRGLRGPDRGGAPSGHGGP